MAVIIIISLIALLTFPNIINQIKKTKKSNNKMIEDVVIEQAKKYVSDNKDELLEDEYCLSISTLIDNDYIKEEIVDINGIKDNKKVQVISGDKNSYKIVDNDDCVPTAVKYLLKKTNTITVTNYTDGDIHEMYTFEHEATVQTPALTDYRYIGNDPNNYVEFNNELWRIIGVFETDDGTGNYEKRVKIIRNDSLGNNQWNASNINEWVDSTMQLYLNDTYTIENNFKKMIGTTKWYLGAPRNGATKAEDIYLSERSQSAYDSSRSKYWIGLIGLMSVSDYKYTYSLGVNNQCYTNSCAEWQGGLPTSGWLYISELRQWVITPSLSTYGDAVFAISSGGIGVPNGGAKNSLATRPALYLKSNVKITFGDGTESNPYKLSMKES